MLLGKNDGSRYWKGAVKRGASIMRQGVWALNTSKDKASVIGSLVGGGTSVIKLGVYDLWS